MRPVILDLYCGAGGASMGYHQAGFDVVGVDIHPQPNYPFRFVQADAIEYLSSLPWTPSAVHASPPCQRYSKITKRWGRSTEHPDLIGPTRDALLALDVPFVIENVEEARHLLHEPVRLCGSSFGLDLRRHRYFEANWNLRGQPCDHSWQTPRFRIPDKRVKSGLACTVPVYGNVNYAGEFDLRCKAMEIDWMTNAELIEAIPPAFTRWIGAQLLDVARPNVAA